jgi:hypothetical protein
VDGYVDGQAVQPVFCCSPPRHPPFEIELELDTVTPVAVNSRPVANSAAHVATYVMLKLGTPIYQVTAANGMRL